MAAGAKMGNGQSCDDFERDFDGSTPVADFEIPEAWLAARVKLDAPDVFGDTEWNTEQIRWELAKMVQSVAREAVDEALERTRNRAHNNNNNGGHDV